MKNVNIKNKDNKIYQREKIYNIRVCQDTYGGAYTRVRMSFFIMDGFPISIYLLNLL